MPPESWDTTASYSRIHKALRTADVCGGKPVLKAPIAIALGAIPGACSRYALGIVMGASIESSFPAGTMVINLTGCGLMGLLITLSPNRLALSAEVRLLIATGFLGAYTTFSTYTLDIALLLEQGNWPQSLIYGLGSPGLGLVSFYGGSYLGRCLAEPKTR